MLLANDAGLCDFDRACAGPIAADLASFHSHSIAEDPAHGASFAADFVAAYSKRASLPTSPELAWWNAAGTAYVADQMPMLISGGLFGLALRLLER